MAYKKENRRRNTIVRNDSKGTSAEERGKSWCRIMCKNKNQTEKSGRKKRWQNAAEKQADERRSRSVSKSIKHRENVRCACMRFVIYHVYNSEDRANIFIFAQHTDTDNENENETLTNETKRKMLQPKMHYVWPRRAAQRKKNCWSPRNKHQNEKIWPKHKCVWRSVGGGDDNVGQLYSNIQNTKYVVLSLVCWLALCNLSAHFIDSFFSFPRWNLLNKSEFSFASKYSDQWACDLFATQFFIAANVQIIIKVSECFDWRNGIKVLKGNGNFFFLSFFWQLDLAIHLNIVKL